MRIGDYATKRVVAVLPTEPISRVRNLMLKMGISHVLIADRGLLGIVTKKDISRRLASESAPWRRRPIDAIPIGRVMTSELVTAASNAPIGEAAAAMVEHGISSVPIVNEGELVGIITKTDLVRAYLENCRGMHKVRELMSRGAVTVNRFHTISHILALMEEKCIGRVIVVDGRKPAGIVTYTDLSFFDVTEPRRGVKRKETTFVRKGEKAGRPRCRHVKTFLATAEDLMSEKLVTVSSSEDAAEAAALILDKGTSALPVVDGGELEGVVTKTDIARSIR